MAGLEVLRDGVAQARPQDHRDQGNDVTSLPDEGDALVGERVAGTRRAGGGVVGVHGHRRRRSFNPVNTGMGSGSTDLSMAR